MRIRGTYPARSREANDSRRNKPADSPITGFETAPLQRRKREGNKIGVLLYRFDPRGESI